MITLTYRTLRTDGEVSEDYPTERLLCLRAVALIRSGTTLTLRVNGSLTDPEAFPARLALIERRREAVAAALGRLTGVHAPGPAHTHWSRLLEQADRLIAAYEGALLD